MKGIANTNPEVLVYRNDKAQIRYNIHEIDVEGSTPQHEYNYIEVDLPLTRKSIIDSLIRAKLDVNDEFALLQLPNDDPEYLEYRDFITGCKAIADEVIVLV